LLTRLTPPRCPIWLSKSSWRWPISLVRPGKG
jgi:hypothetical protein